MAAQRFAKDDLFVSPKGNDNWSGRLPKPNKDGTDGPLASLAGAQQALRRRKGLARDKHDAPLSAGLNRPVTVWLRGGRYELTAPVVFTPADSAPITFKAFPREKPVLDGGRRITGWKQTKIHGRTAWVVDLPEVADGTWQFRSLFVNGERRQRPRLPEHGLWRMRSVPGLPERGGWGPGGYTRFTCNKGEVKRFANLTDVDRKSVV